MKPRYPVSVGAIILMMMLVVPGCGLQSRVPQAPPLQTKTEPTISLYNHQTGAISKIKMEDYVMGVVAAEMDPGWPVNALAAQAILARTFTLKKIQMGGVKAHGTDASTSVEEFQAYAPEKINDNVRRAVAMTRGMVVTFRGNYINGWFHADAGGQTAASAVEGLAYRKETTPYIISVTDPGSRITEPVNRYWTVRFPLSQVREAVRQAGGKDPGAIRTVTIVDKGPSGRALTVRVNEVTLSAPALRLALGSEKMRSTFIDKLTVEGGTLVISGKGFGHGVGMSQWGARYLAEQGKKAEEIINYYYHGVRLQKAWS